VFPNLQTSPGVSSAVHNVSNVHTPMWAPIHGNVVLWFRLSGNRKVCEMWYSWNAITPAVSSLLITQQTLKDEEMTHL